MLGQSPAGETPLRPTEFFYRERICGPGGCAYSRSTYVSIFLAYSSPLLTLHLQPRRSFQLYSTPPPDPVLILSHAHFIVAVTNTTTVLRSSRSMLSRMI